MIRNIGITATRDGLTARQFTSVFQLFRNIKTVCDNSYKIAKLHQGCCVGGDEQLTIAAIALGMDVAAHPPTDSKLLSKLALDLSHTKSEPLPYLERNRVIVDQCDTIIAAPNNYENMLRSGTWSTYRYAKLNFKKIFLVLPNGVVQRWSHEGDILRNYDYETEGLGGT